MMFAQQNRYALTMFVLLAMVVATTFVAMFHAVGHLQVFR
jgi:hypothetical protein